ncbi:MAG: hypothetical protein ACRYG2_15585 [Janthinobacterium lividum]
MTVLTRDAWADATMVATQEVVDDDVAAVRRRLRLRHALVLVLELVAVLAALALVDHFIDPSSDALWAVPRRTRYSGSYLVGVAAALMIIGTVRRGGSGRRFLDPADFLTRADRSWLRTQIAEQRAVPQERRAVVSDTARRMVGEGRYTPAYLGWILLCVGTTVSAPLPGPLITFSALVVLTSVRGVRDLVRSRRARRWLALNP